MFSRFIGLILLIASSYVLLIFAAPSLADQYWNPELNAKIRKYKDQSLQFASGSDTPQSLIEKITDATTSYIEDTKKVVEDVNTTISNKVDQVQDASVAVQSAYSGVVDAAKKIQGLTGTGAR